MKCRDIIKFRRNVSIGKGPPWYNKIPSLVLVLYEQLNGIGNFYQWLLAVLGFHEITCSVDGEQLDHERNSGVLNMKNEVEIIDHDITDDEMDKRREAKTLDYKHKLECEKKRV